ncbi:N-acetyltransferase 6-like [Ctenocephalides felis]|uniref:N-acetyltransferase 6-like n=1 Tax=Ctenocephalides felis TaxID=7515 RepID=UPI000E6E34B3|nr:N-acetyltransferase 6-like [Ctenocephalides felis]
MKNEFKVEPAHDHPDLLEQCCELINAEWPRSLGARMRSLMMSSEKLPTSLIMLQDKTGIIGHAKLTPIPSMPQACFVESVVIAKNLRGKGLGRELMYQVEKYCKSKLNLKQVILSTQGQEQFYSKLGYKECPPISLYGSGSFAIPNFIRPLKKTYMKKDI